MAAQPEFPVPCATGPDVTPLEYGNYTTGCQISPASDSDVFSFEGEAGDLIWIMVAGLTYHLDPQLVLRDPGNTSLGSAYCEASSATKCSFSKAFTLPETGTYSITVSDRGDNNTGSYILQLEIIHPFPPDPVALEYSVPVGDTVSPVSDIDFFAFHAEAETQVEITIAGLTYHLDPSLLIYSPDGVALDSASCSASSATKCSASTGAVSIEDSGVHLVAVWDGGLNNTGNYNLTLECLGTNCPLYAPVKLCEVEMSQSSYSEGEDLTIEYLSVWNPYDDPICVEWKLWIRPPELALVKLVNSGHDGSQCLPPGLDHVFGPIPLGPVTPDHPEGSWEIGCRMLDPYTGKALPVGTDLNSFQITRE
jgi:hypothetical protein